jgi:hypothetical protein
MPQVLSPHDPAQLPGADCATTPKEKTMKRLVLALALSGSLAACSHNGSDQIGKVPGAEPALALGVFAVAACFIIGECS